MCGWVDQFRTLAGWCGSWRENTRTVVSGGGEHQNTRTVVSGGGEHQNTCRVVLGGGGQRKNTRTVVSGGGESQNTCRVVWRERAGEHSHGGVWIGSRAVGRYDWVAGKHGRVLDRPAWTHLVAVSRDIDATLGERDGVTAAPLDATRRSVFERCQKKREHTHTTVRVFCARERQGWGVGGGTLVVLKVRRKLEPEPW